MKNIFFLSGEDISLAKEEALALTNPKEYEIVERLLVLDTKQKDLDKRLAYTKRIHEYLFETNARNLKKAMSAFDWQSIYKNNFCIRITNLTNKKIWFSEAQLASYVWKAVKKPKVNLANPETLIELFFTDKKIICGLLLEEIRRDFKERRAHKRPELHPTSLHPKLARACINLTGIKKGTVVDPFCGSGGILLEAGLMGLRPVGHDIDQIMLNRAKINLKHFGIKNHLLEKLDATKLDKKIDYVVTDLPYGKNTKQKNLEELYLRFLKNLKKILKNRAVVIFPSFIKHKKLLSKSRLKIKNEFVYYLHKSLSKRIVVLEA